MSSCGDRLPLVTKMPTRPDRQQQTKVAPTLHRLSVTYRATGSIKPDPRNARTHSKGQVEQIIASIREFGFTNPILIDPDGGLIAGHGRLLAAKSLDMTEVPTIELVGLNDAQKRALRLANNKIALRCDGQAGGKSRISGPKLRGR